MLAPDLVAVAFGSRWEGLVPPFQVLGLGMMFRTCYRMSDSLSRATGKVYRRAWRQGLYARLVFLGALVGQTWGVRCRGRRARRLFLNYVLMAQLSLASPRSPGLASPRCSCRRSGCHRARCVTSTIAAGDAAPRTAAGCRPRRGRGRRRGRRRGGVAGADPRLGARGRPRTGNALRAYCCLGWAPHAGGSA